MIERSVEDYIAAHKAHEAEKEYALNPHLWTMEEKERFAEQAEDWRRHVEERNRAAFPPFEPTLRRLLGDTLYEELSPYFVFSYETNGKEHCGLFHEATRLFRKIVKRPFFTLYVDAPSLRLVPFYILTYPPHDYAADFNEAAHAKPLLLIGPPARIANVWWAIEETDRGSSMIFEIMFAALRRLYDESAEADEST